MEYDNTNRGVLFKNERKEKDTDADYTGSYTNVNGEDHWLNAWLAKDKNGNTYMRLSTKLKQEVHAKGMQQARQALAPKPDEGFDSDIPF